jgi:hypothetical protein
LSAARLVSELGPAQFPLPDRPSPCRGPARPRSTSPQAVADRPPPMVCRHGARAASLVACFPAIMALSFASAPLCSSSMVLPWSFPARPSPVAPAPARPPLCCRTRELAGIARPPARPTALLPACPTSSSSARAPLLPWRVPRCHGCPVFGRVVRALPSRPARPRLCPCCCARAHRCS